jgi:hypothetical protein
MQKDHLEILLEDISSKFSLVLEGHGAIRVEMQKMHEDLTEKIEHNSFLINVVNQKVDKLEIKVDNIAADLAAHRADTEAHQGLYLVKEG